ncbi:MAG: ABC transporter permease [Actinomycetota bacterium]
MLKATLKSLLAHKLRLALTALAVVLGVGFMAGTLVFTDTIKNSINGLFAKTTAGKSAVVRGQAQFTDKGARGGQHGFGGNARPLVPQSLLATVKAVPGVVVADGSVQGVLSLVGGDGKALAGAARGAPTLGFAWEPDRALSALVLRSGRAPERPGELVLDRKTATANKLTVGTPVIATGNLGPQPFVIVGIVGFGSQDTLAGATIVAFDTGTAQRVVGKPGFFTEIDVAGAPGAPSDPLVTAMGAALPPGFEAISAATGAKESSTTIDSFIGIFNTVLLAFAGIALFVGAFLIFNTFSILIGQRTRELALLRAVGAGRGQVTTSVLGEAFLTGVFGSLVGLGFGIALAFGLYSFLKGFLSLGTASLQILPRTIILSMTLGTLITLVSAVLPAIRASQVPPVAAMRDDFVAEESSLRLRAILGSAVLLVGLGVLALGLLGAKSALAVGIGAGISFIGVAMLLPLVATPLARAIGAPLPLLQGVTGRLGRENSARNPRRTAATASALMIGVAVVAAIATLASSALASFTGIFDKSFQASYVISSSNQEFPAAPAEAALRAAPGVVALSGFSQTAWHLKGASKQVDGIDAVEGPQVFRIALTSGSVAGLQQSQLLVDDTTALADHIKLGDAIPMTFATTGQKVFKVGGVYRANQLLGDHYLLSSAVIAANSNRVEDQVILVKTAASSTDQQAALARALAGFPPLKVQTAAQFKSAAEGQIKGLLKVVYGLLALAITIAVLGVINTLALSVIERTREIGLLRAIGMYRRQVRGMIRGESIVVALLGALLGLILGVAFGAAFVSAVSGSGTFITQLVIPWQTIAIVLVATAVFGIFAAIFPAIRASRLDVLKAVSTV